MLARYDQHALLFSESLNKLEGADIKVISQVRDRSGMRGNKRQVISLSPLPNDRVIRVQNASCSAKKLRSVFGSERDLREHVARRTRANSSVVVIRPGARNKLRR